MSRTNHAVPADGPTEALDAVDRKILAVLRADGRAAIADIARAVGLSAAPVSRRIDRLERSGVIRGYTAIIDDGQTGSLEAFTEVRLTGPTKTGELEGLVTDIAEVLAVHTIAGDPDALIHLRVDGVDHLQRIVNRLRATGKLVGTKTMIVLHTSTRTS